MAANELVGKQSEPRMYGHSEKVERQARQREREGEVKSTEESDMRKASLFIERVRRRGCK